MERFAVLTSSSGVSEDVAAHVATSLNGDPKRLNENAVEVAFSGDPALIELDGIDLNYISAQNRTKSLLIADMDSTIITVECIDELADFAGKKAEVSETDDIQTCFDQRVELSPGSVDLIKAMNQRGMTALVSGGFTVFTDKVSEQVGFQFSQIGCGL